MQKQHAVRLAFACTAWLVCGLSGSATHAQVQAQWDLDKGDKFVVTLVQNSNTRTQVDARITSIQSDNQIVMDWNVTSVDENGDMTIEQSLKSIKLSVGDPAVPAQAVKYDTAGTNNEISKTSRKLLEQVQPLIGLKFIVVMSKPGEIKTVTLPDETTEAKGGQD